MWNSPHSIFLLVLFHSPNLDFLCLQTCRAVFVSHRSCCQYPISTINNFSVLSCFVTLSEAIGREREDGVIDPSLWFSISAGERWDWQFSIFEENQLYFGFKKNSPVHPHLCVEDKVFCSNASCTLVKEQLQYHESCLYKMLAYCYRTTDLWKPCQNMTRGQSTYCRSSIVTLLVLTLISAPVLHDLGKVILVASTFGPKGAELSKP